MRLGVRLVTDDIARLIPLCDVFVASVSATISMALACGKPVVNYDVYRFRYDDFEGVPDLHTFENRSEFAQRLTKCWLMRIAWPPAAPMGIGACWTGTPAIV